MDKKIIELAKKQDAVEPAALLAFISVETGGQGFNPATGKIIIQFEPVHFRKKAPFAPSGKWSVNKVDVQSKEWEAFNDAFAKNADAAMQSTSIGIGQIMGFHFARLGYKTVGAMWDDAKKGIENQFNQLLKFIKTDTQLWYAIEAKNWDTVAKLYNGAKYKELAKRIGREPYDISLAKAYQIFKTTIK